MSELELEIPKMRYDITMPLLEGRVPIEGVKFKPVAMSAMINSLDSPLRDGNFGLFDLNISYLLPAIEAGWQVSALPVFSKRKPVYQYIFCRSDSGIQSPKDLEGKRIGTGLYRTAITTWVRGLLKDRHKVDFSNVQWVAQSMGPFPNHDRASKIELADRKKTPVERLMDGEIDAFVGDVSDAKLFEVLESSPKVRRLFPNYPDEDEKLYRETGIYTVMHLIVMSKKLDHQYPDLAGKLYKGFEQEKKIAYEDILSDRAGFSVLYLRERLKEQTERWGDPFKYGIKANKHMIDTVIRHNHEQGAIQSSLSYGNIFPSSLLDT